MSWNKSDFLGHYKKVRIEGQELQRLLNTCLLNGVKVKKIKYVSASVIYVQVDSRDFKELEKIAGNRYLVTVSSEGGMWYKTKGILKNKSLVAGLILFIGVMIYQSLFIAEIEISGYESISEKAIRTSLHDAGFYEGCRKNINLNRVKLDLIEDFENISWVGIRYKGNLAQVTIAEVENTYEEYTVEEAVPCNIVADKSGYISNVNPEDGIRAVEDGQYVREGEVLISGAIPLQKTTYDEEDPDGNIQYVHAGGTVKAKVPVRLNFYMDPYELRKEKTGKKMVTFSLNDREFFRGLCPYETSQVKQLTLLNSMKPVRVKISINLIEEIVVKRQKIAKNQVEKILLNEIQKYVKEKLPDNAQILNKSLNFSTEKNIIDIGVTLETLQKIGKEEEIIVDKSNRKSEENDDQ